MNSLKDKIYNYEVTPPAGTWDKIAIDLDEAELANKFPDRLYNMDATPPASSWEKVNASLNPASDPVAIPLLKRITPFLRYAAAAIFMALSASRLDTCSEVSPSTGFGKTSDGTEIIATFSFAISANFTVEPFIPFFSQASLQFFQPDFFSGLAL